MPNEDEETAARDRVISNISGELKVLLPDVLAATGIEGEQSLHAKFGGKYAEYIDIRHAVIHSPEHFVALYLDGFVKRVGISHYDNAHTRNLALLRSTPILKRYVSLFLKRTYLRNYEALSKTRPKDEESEIWIGQRHANYGWLITPRFNSRESRWSNDRSAIRHFDQPYWSLGHLLQTGLVVPDRNESIQFRTIEEWLGFVLNVIVRSSGSQYELELFTIYRDYALSAPEPAVVPLLLPEFRYGGLQGNHEYRLDFTVIEAQGLNKFGFELSPWSTHGYLSKLKGLTQKVVNEMARDNFEKEMAKHKAFFRKWGIFTQIYTDADLTDLTSVFTDVQRCLVPAKASQQLQFQLIEDILGPQ